MDAPVVVGAVCTGRSLDTGGEDVSATLTASTAAAAGAARRPVAGTTHALRREHEVCVTCSGDGSVRVRARNLCTADSFMRTIEAKEVSSVLPVGFPDSAATGEGLVAVLNSALAAEAAGMQVRPRAQLPDAQERGCRR